MDLIVGRGFIEFVKLSHFESSMAFSSDDDEADDSSPTSSLTVIFIITWSCSLFYAGMLTLLNIFLIIILQIFVVG